ncbi:MAG TPA: SDR family oxidoreductase [Acidimicrobiales bacterium]|nr:SDR family oxidoreductase [Acidimicrobiales bacterium]
MELSGGAVLVTGGASGIGRAVVRRMAGAGASVAVLDRVDATGHEGVEMAVACDISDEVAVVAAIRRVHEALGGLSHGVLAAGVGGFGPLLELEATEWDRVVGINLRGSFLCLRELARVMVESGQGGSVVAVTSISGFLADRGMSHYSVSKAGVAELVRVAARELGPFGIRVNGVAPGTTDTPMFASTARLAGYADRVGERTPLGGVGSPDEVAQAIVGVLGMPWVTGQVLAADGGVSLWSPIDPMESMVPTPPGGPR